LRMCRSNALSEGHRLSAVLSQRLATGT
jgi:hypothetical protein